MISACLRPSFRRNCAALAVISTFVLQLSGCGDSNLPSTKQEAVKQTPEQLFASTLKKAEAGDAQAQKEVGVMYSKGEGVAKDPASAMAWFEKAAAQGNIKAQHNIGVLYAQGEGVPRDMKKALEWWQKAAAQGNPTSQASIGWTYANGNGVPKDLKKAAEWYEKAATQGDSTAQFLLGDAYYSGEGVTRNLTTAVEWYLKSAEQGYADAQVKLGTMYYLGEGVPKDSAKTEMWYRKAAEQNDSGGQYLLGLMYYKGDGVPKDMIQAVEWWQKAAVQGHSAAMANLGWAYAAGEGISMDRVLAYAWANLAASKGNETGIQNRNIYEAQLSQVERAEAQRLSSNWKLGQLMARGNNTTTKNSPTLGSAGALSKQGTGTAFFVSATGDAITNHHVIDDCKEVRAEGRDGVVKVVTTDVVNDVALLQIPGRVSAVATMASEPTKLRQGEEIVVFGFPLNALLSSGGNLTPGVVSALTGVGNNTNQIQITAPIQPGSSGSPVLNKKSEVVGMVSMKLSDTKMVKITGSIGQNVNFAVSGQTLNTFLDTHHVKYSTGGFAFFDKSAADLADEGRKWTTVVECWK